MMGEVLEKLKPKNIKTVEFNGQKIIDLENKIASSEQQLSTLTPENRQKYANAYQSFLQKAADNEIAGAQGYDVLVVDHISSPDTVGGFSMSQSGENEIMLRKDFIEKASELELTSLLLHEIIGHAITSKNQIKHGPNTRLVTSGLVNLKYTTNKPLNISRNILKQSLETIVMGGDLTAEQLYIFDSLEEYFDTSDKMTLISKAFDLIPDSVQGDEFTDVKMGLEQKIIGNPLNEGVTELMAILMCSDTPEQIEFLLKKTGYRRLVSKLIDVSQYLHSLNEDYEQQWIDCLQDAKMNGQPYKIIRFLQDKTGVFIKPKELFELDFSKILKN